MKLTLNSYGSVQVNIGKKQDIENIELYLPDLPTQKKIIDLLSSLEDKIEINNRIIQELE